MVPHSLSCQLISIPLTLFLQIQRIFFFFLRNKMTGEFSGGPLVRTVTSTAGEQVWSPVRELRSPCGMNQRKKKKRRKKEHDLLFCFKEYCTAINMFSFLFWHCPSSRLRTKESIIATFFQFYQKKTVILFCFNFLKNCKQQLFHKTKTSPMHYLYMYSLRP